MAEAQEETALAMAELAVSRGMLTREQADEALVVMAKMQEMGVPEELGRILIKKGFVSEAQLRQLESSAGTGQPARIGGFEILSRLGRGGMGAVYKARQVSMDRLVALKVLPPGLAKDKDFIERFFREARAVAKLNHPNIVQGIDVGVADKYYYFAMEYVEGETVQNILVRDGPMAEKRALEIVLQVAQALHHAQRNSMIHRDIKPDNIMVTAGGVAKLCDLGLAKSLAGDSSMTQSGLAVGTPHYISPEQARGDHDVDIRADIYSLGATLYHMVVGKTPYSGSSAAVVMTKHLNDDVPNPRDERADLSMGLVRLVEKMMAKEPRDRYQSPEELIGDVNLVLAGKSPAALRLAAGRSVVKGATAKTSGRVRGAVQKTAATRAVEPVAGARAPVLALAVGAGVLLLGGIGVGLAVYLGRDDRTVMPPPPGNGGTENTTNNGNKPPPVSPEELARQERLRLLSIELQNICNRWEKNPTDFKRVLQDLQRLSDRAGGTDVKLQVQGKISEVEAAQAKHVDELLKGARARAEKFLAENKFRAAYDCFNDLPLLPGVMEEVTKDQTRIKALAMSRFETIKRDAWTKLGPKVYTDKNRGDLAAAEKHLETARAMQITDVDTALDAALAELRTDHQKRTEDLEKRLAEERDRQQREMRAAFDEERDKVFAAAAAVKVSTDLYDFAGARAKADAQLVQDSRFQPFAAEAKRISRDLGQLADFQAGLEAAVGAQKGQQCSVEVSDRKEEGLLVYVDSKGLGLRPRNMGGGWVTHLFRDVAPADLARLAGRPADTPAGAYLAGILAFYSGRHGLAVGPLRVAEKDAKLKRDAQYYLGFALKAYRERMKKEAEDLLEKCRQQYQRLKAGNVPKGDPQWAALRDDLQRLKKDYADTDVVKANLGE